MTGIAHRAGCRAFAGAVVAGVVATAGLPLPAFAQVAPQLPPQSATQTGGVLTRDELRSVTQTPAEAAAPRLSIAGGIERSPCPLADPRFKDIKVTISSVLFNGLKGASPEELEPAWKPFANGEQPVATLCEVRDAAATILRNKGYLAAVQVPTQTIEGGQVRMEVLFARVTAIRARGETRGAERKLEEYLDRLTKDEIFDRNRAERYLLLARDLPGYNVQLTLRPAGTGVGDLIGEVSVLRRGFVVDATIQNLAPRTTGPFGGQVRAQAFGLTGLGDVTTISGYITADGREQQILQGSHEFRPGSEGLVLGIQATHAWTRPDIGTAAGGVIRARTLFSGIYARYPLLRTQGQNLYLSGGFDYLNQKVDFTPNGSPLTRLSRDRLRVLWAKLDFDKIDLKHRTPRYRVAGTLELRQGIDVFNAAKPCALGAARPAGCVDPSNAFGTPTATVVRGQGTLELAFGQVGVAFLPRAQYAFKPVYSFEQIAFGNYTIGRGYDPGTLAGDDGVGLAGELRGPRFGVGPQGRLSLQPYAFGDVGYTWTKKAAQRLLAPGAQRLSSAGAGLRGELGDRFRIETFVAVPIERAGLQTKKEKVRVFVSLTTRLLPWRKN